MAAVKHECGCLVGDDGPIVLCRKTNRLANTVNDLIPPFGDDEPHDWDTFHRALRDYRRHIGESSEPYIYGDDGAPSDMFYGECG